MRLIRPRATGSSTSRLAAAAVAVALVVAVTAACGEEGGDKGATPTTVPMVSTVPVTGTITVFAAASLTAAFTEAGKRFEAAHPGATVKFSFGGSSALARQILAGAPADVLATADEASLMPAAAAGLVNRSLDFATNRLAMAVRPGNPAGIHGLADLARPGLVLVLCAAEVPCGKFAAKALTGAGVTVKPASLEPDVKAVLSKVTLGEADAGIVYSTDVVAAKGAEAVNIPAAQNVQARYPLAVLKGTDAARMATAAAFADYVASAEGLGILAGFGFGPP